MKNTIFRIRLGNLISAMGINQGRFAVLVGITPAALSQILDGKREPAFSTLDKIHMNTGADIQYLMGYRLGEKKSPNG